MFNSVTLFDLRKNTFQEIISGAGIHPVIQDADDAQKALALYLDEFVSYSDKSHMQYFLNLATLPERLGSQKSISAEFFGTEGNWVRASFLPVLSDENGNVQDVLLITQLIDEEKNATLKYQSELKRALDDAVKLAEVDGMTQLFNRRSGEKYVNQSLSKGNEGMFCVFDIDDFKHFNDVYGHVVGDKVLQGVASCMKQSFRDADILIRTGGDEFVVFAIGLQDKAFGEQKLQELAHRIDEMTFAEFQEKVTLSVGAVYTADCEKRSFEELFKAADMLMYRNKKTKCCNRI